MNKNLLFQRNELLSSIQKKIRKFFGRYLFTNFFVFFFTNKKVDKDYFDISYNELKNLKQHIPKKTKNVLSIGCGLAGFEVLLQNYILKYTKFFNRYITDINTAKDGKDGNYVNFDKYYNDIPNHYKIFTDDTILKYIDNRDIELLRE